MWRPAMFDTTSKRSPPDINPQDASARQIRWRVRTVQWQSRLIMEVLSEGPAQVGALYELIDNVLGLSSHELAETIITLAHYGLIEHRDLAAHIDAGESVPDLLGAHSRLVIRLSPACLDAP